MKELGIVIPVFNNWYYTKKIIQQLLELPESNLIVIVDNGSTDETKSLCASNRLEVIRNDTNLGFARSCNQGYHRAVRLGCENVMFLNNDVKVFDDFGTWTGPIIDRVKAGSIVGPTVGCLDDNLNFISEGEKIPSKGHWYLSGWCITAQVKTWKKLCLEDGPFTTEFITYFEDTDLGFRAQKQGISCELIKIPVKHFGKATSKRLGISKLYLHAKPLFLAKWKGKI